MIIGRKNLELILVYAKLWCSLRFCSQYTLMTWQLVQTRKRFKHYIVCWWHYFISSFCCAIGKNCFI